MQFVGKMITSVSEFYKDINPSTLSGAIDVLVVEDVKTGRLACSPFHVRFGKLQLLRPQEKVVEMRVNGTLTGVQMKVGEAGETFFVLPVQGAVKEEYLTSPLVQPIAGLNDAEGFSLSPEKQPGRHLPRKQPESEGETELALGHVGALSDSELEIKDRNGEEVRDALMAGSPPKYSWMWGGLPQRTKPQGGNFSDPAVNQAVDQTVDEAFEQTEIQLAKESLEPMVVEPTGLRTPDQTTEQTVEENGVDPSAPVPSPEVHLDPLSDGSTLQSSPPSQTAELQIDLFEWIRRPQGIKRNYDELTLLVANKKEQINVTLLRPTQHSKPSPIHFPFKDEGGEPDVLGVIKSCIAQEMFSTVSWAAFEDAPGALLAELTTKESHWIVLIEDRLVLPGGIGFYLLWGRALFAQLLSLETCLRLLNDDSQSPTIPALPAAPLPIPQNTNTNRSSNSSGGWRWWSRTSSAVPPELKESSLIVHATTASSSTTVVPPHQLLPSTTSALPSPSPPSTINNVEMETGTPIDPKANIQFQKSLRLPHEMLEQLNLQPGANTMSFTVHTRLQGTATCLARIFRWRNDSRIIISDVDGTITKSDALGHLFAIVGRDWTHSDVAKLYSDIERNGYRFVYLTSRSLGQANSTRGYLRSVEQNGRFQLPDGPVIMSPDRLLAALRREVVLGNPQEFKIACLKDLQLLFTLARPSDKESNPEALPSPQDSTNPFYAGFGNRTNDAAAYLAIGIPPQRIFIVNPAGTLAFEPLSDHYHGSYAQLIDLVDQIFPPLSQVEAEEYNDFWYWRRPLSVMVGVQRDAAARSVIPLRRSPLEDVATVEDAEGKNRNNHLVDPDHDEDSGEEEESLVPAYYI